MRNGMGTFLTTEDTEEVFWAFPSQAGRLRYILKSAFLSDKIFIKYLTPNTL